MIRKKWILPSTAGVALLAMLTGCAAGEAPAPGDGGDNPVVIYASLPLSGNMSPLGEAERAALEAGVDVINDEGGILGRDVVLEVVDNKFDAAEAVSLLQERLSQPTLPDLVFPGASSVETVPSLPILGQFNQFAIGLSASPLANKPDEYPNVFMAGNTSASNAAAVRTYVEDQGFKSLAVLNTDNETCVANGDGLEKLAQDMGLPVSRVALDPGAVDATAQLSQLQASSPDALLVCSFGAQVQVIMQGILKLNWDIPVIAETSTATTNFGAIMSEEERANLYGIMLAYQVQGHEAQATDAFKAFEAALAKTEPEKDNYGLYTYAVAYGPLMLFRAAAEKAGSLDAAALSEAMLSFESATDVPGWFLSQNIGFTADSHVPTYVPADYAVIPIGTRDVASGSDIPGGQ